MDPRTQDDRILPTPPGHRAIWLRAKACWTDHSIPDVWREAATKNHPHGKPVELQKRLIEAVTRDGDTVVDPAAGGYSVLEACRLSGRTFIGCDITFD